MSSIRLTRQLSSLPQTHRTSTLQAISDKTHAITARIEYVKVEMNRLRNLAGSAPGTGQSRIDWIHRQLQNP